MGWLKNLIELSKLSTKKIIWLWIFSGILLILGKIRLDFFHLESILKTYDSYIALIFICFSVLLSINFVVFLWEKYKVSGHDYKKTLNNLLKDWQDIISSAGDLETIIGQNEVSNDYNSYAANLGMESSLYRNINFHYIDFNCGVILRYTKLLSNTINEIESIAEKKPKIQYYLKEMKNVSLNGEFNSKEEAIEYLKNSVIRIIDILKKIKKSILKKID